MDAPEQSELVKLAVLRNVGEWAYGSKDGYFIGLTKSFEDSVAILEEMLSEEISKVETFFTNLSAQDLLFAAGKEKSRFRSDFEDELHELTTALERRIHAPDKYHIMALGGHAHELANYVMWANYDSFTEEELVWLSIGLEPTAELTEAYRAYQSGKTGLLGYVGLEVDQRLKIVGRSQTLGSFGTLTVKGTTAYEWINSIDLKTPLGFRTMLETCAVRLSRENSDVSATKPGLEAPMDGRERMAMSKLIAAMAIDGYGFDPLAKRSGIPKEIQDVADRLGLNLSASTIRKYLRQGTEQLPKDWSPN